MHAKRLRAVLLSGAIAVLMAAPSTVWAVTLADALVIAYQTSPLLDSGKAALRGLDESVPQARSARRPQVDVGVSASTATSYDDLGAFLDDARNDQLEAALNLSLLVFDNGQTKAAVEAARNRVAAGRADFKDIEQFVLFSAVEAYVNVRRDQEFVRLANNDVDRLEETLRATENRFEVGEVTRTDVSQSEARLAESRSVLATSSGELEISEEAYRAAVGVPAVNLEPLPPLPEIPESLEAATAVALQRNPQIIAAQFNVRVAVYDFDRARAAKGPTVSFRGSTGGQAGTNQIGDFEQDTFASIGLSGGMPLYTGGMNDSLVRQAQALLDQRRFELQDTARSVTEQVAASWAQIEVARVSIVARRQQAEASRIAAEGVAEEARLGARSTLDLLDADQERLQAEAQVVEAMRNEYVAVYSLLRAMGLLTVEHLGLGIESYDPDVNFARVQSGPPGGYDTSVVDRIRARWER
jgi:outer membrane protein